MIQLKWVPFTQNTVLNGAPRGVQYDTFLMPDINMIYMQHLILI